jgi:hypothetical protein
VYCMTSMRRKENDVFKRGETAAGDEST